MRNKIVNKLTIKQKIVQPKRRRLWLLVAIAFLGGFVIGCATYYTLINWNGFFATCPNGAHPDKNGCCAGEVYTDAGDGWMVCCPDGGDNCFPPIK